MIVTMKNKDLENEVRRVLQIHDRPLMESDILKITELDLSNHRLDENMIDDLGLLQNIETLDIETCETDLSFLGSFRHLKDLGIVSITDYVDFTHFRSLKSLESLFVSGGDLSNMRLINTDTLIALKNLKELSFHEFGSVDLTFLDWMDSLHYFMCGWSNEVMNIESIANMKNLKTLELDAIKMNSISPFDSLSKDVEISLCGLSFPRGTDLTILKSFKKHDLCEIEIDHKIEIYEDITIDDE